MSILKRIAVILLLNMLLTATSANVAPVQLWSGLTTFMTPELVKRHLPGQKWEESRHDRPSFYSMQIDQLRENFIIGDGLHGLPKFVFQRRQGGAHALMLINIHIFSYQYGDLANVFDIIRPALEEKYGKPVSRSSQPSVASGTSTVLVFETAERWIILRGQPGKTDSAFLTYQAKNFNLKTNSPNFDMI